MVCHPTQNLSSQQYTPFSFNLVAADAPATKMPAAQGYTLTTHINTKLGTEHQANGLPTYQSSWDPPHSNLIITNPFVADTQISRLALCAQTMPHGLNPIKLHPG